MEEIHDKFQFQLYYGCCMDNVFNKDFFKDRIIYAFLPNRIKTYVNSTPE